MDKQEAPAKKARTDWEAIEADYRAGVLSIREIAKLHDVSDTAIRKKAKADDWQRDLTAKVAEKVRAELVRTEVRTPYARGEVRTEREIVDSAAATVVQVVREHRRDIAAGRAIIAMLCSQLVDVAGQRDAFEEVIEIECAEDRSGERRAKLQRAVSIPVHAATVRDLSAAMKNLIGLERQAFSISDSPEPDPEPGTTVAEQVSEGFAELRAAFAKRLGNAGPT
jgi:hypothetical protein